MLVLTGSGAFDDINDAAEATRRPRRKSGAYANLEQAVTADLGVFARASASDGRSESLSFTDIDRSLSGGISLKGTSWERPADTVGIGGAVNGLTRAHQDYFAAGGLGLLIGDGRLNYAPERAFEAYYAANADPERGRDPRLPVRRQSGLQPRSRPDPLLRRPAARGFLSADGPKAPTQIDFSPHPCQSAAFAPGGVASPALAFGPGRRGDPFHTRRTKRPRP